MDGFSSHIRNVRQKLVFGLPFPINAHWQSFKKSETSKNKIFVVYSVDTEQLPKIRDLSWKRDKKHWRKADLIVALKINNTDIGNILQAIIFLKSVILIKDFEWVDIGGKILRCVADNLNSLEKSGSGIKKWHLNKDNNIILIFPSKLIQHDITDSIKKCMEKIALKNK